MPKKDILFVFLILALFTPFFIFPKVYLWYVHLNAEHGIIMSFFKFAILATLGEIIGLRIRKGTYYEKGFGLVPRAIVWGFLGITIKMAFVIFASGTPAFLVYLGFDEAVQILKSPLSWSKVSVAFSISMAMNLIYAPIMMTLHKITDLHILQTHGTIRGFFTPIPIRKIMSQMNWDVMWNFVFKKTIPFFWIPAHTITFLLPPDFQVLFAALLGIALGIILAVADLSNKKMHQIIQT
ncbi:MAG: Mpv17/PMP22 family protein [Bacteroidales bacterium]|nr:Mpv17/PMP22 family protein [Bacteroidales bacterium]